MISLLFPSWCGYFCCFLMSQILLMELRVDCMPEKDLFFFFSFFSFQFCEFFIIIILIKKIDWSCHRDVFWKKDTSRVLHVTFFNILSRVTTSSTCWHIVNSEKVQDRNLHTGALSKVLKFKKLCFFSTALSEKKQSCIETFISVSLDISQALGGNYHNMKWDVHIFEDSNT